MKEKRINGLDVNEFGEGNSPTVIFIHAFPLCCRMWDPQIDAFKNKYHVVVYDLRGFGYSEIHDCHLTVDDHADDLMALIESLRLERPIICGLSMGGYIALRAMEKYGNMFKGAILADTKSEADVNAAKLKRAEQMRMIKRGEKEKFFDGFLALALSERTQKERPATAAFLKEIMSWQKEEGITGALLTLAARTDTTEGLDKIDIPTLIIEGEEDKVVPPEFAKSLNERIRNSKLVMIPGAGHFPNLENTKEFNRAVEEFLTNIEG
jgi:3-oxoadipate enol-lactonase